MANGDRKALADAITWGIVTVAIALASWDTYTTVDHDAQISAIHQQITAINQSITGLSLQANAGETRQEAHLIYEGQEQQIKQLEHQLDQLQADIPQQHFHP